MEALRKISLLFSTQSLRKKLTAFFLILLAIITPVAIVSLQSQQTVKQQAANVQGSATLSFSPQTQSVSTSQNVSEDIYLDPGNDTVSFLSLDIVYDPLVLSFVSFIPHSSFTSFSQSPTPTSICIPRPPCIDATPRCMIAQPKDGWCPSKTPFQQNANGQANLMFSLGVGSDPTKAITAKTNVGTLTFQTLQHVPKTTLSFAPDTTALALTTQNPKSNIIASLQDATITLPEQNQAVTISSISPQHGSAGASITITGTGFTQDNAIVFTKDDNTLVGYVTHVPSTTTTVSFTLPTSVQLGCVSLPTDSPDMVHCMALAKAPLTPGSYMVNVLSKNGKSNALTFAIDDQQTVTPTGNPSPTTQTVFLPLDITLFGIDSTKTPKHIKRTVIVTIVDKAGNQVAQVPGTVTFDSQSGTFKGLIDLTSQAFPNLGSYSVKVKTDGYLRKQSPSVFHFANGQNTPITLTLTPGDINGDNRVDILDYNILSDCFGPKLLTDTCNTHIEKNLADFDDDGIIDGVDYNILLRSLTVQSGD